MIFVVLGTWGMSFSRPLIEIERLIKNGIIKENVIVQAGATKFKSDMMEVVDFFSKEKFDSYYKEASFIISQSGEGSIMNGLKYDKKVIVIARLIKYGEHIDNHQLDILNTFTSKGYILPWKDNETLEQVIQNLDSFIPIKYPFGQGKISERIIEFLENGKIY